MHVCISFPRILISLKLKSVKSLVKQCHLNGIDIPCEELKLKHGIKNENIGGWLQNSRVKGQNGLTPETALQPVCDSPVGPTTSYVRRPRSSHLLHVFVKVVTCICQSLLIYLSNCFIYFCDSPTGQTTFYVRRPRSSDLLNVFVTVVTCILQSCYVFVKVISFICQNCFKYFCGSPAGPISYVRRPRSSQKKQRSSMFCLPIQVMFFKTEPKTNRRKFSGSRI